MGLEVRNGACIVGRRRGGGGGWARVRAWGFGGCCGSRQRGGAADRAPPPPRGRRAGARGRGGAPRLRRRPRGGGEGCGGRERAICATSMLWVRRVRKLSPSWKTKTWVLYWRRRKAREWMIRSRSRPKGERASAGSG